MGAEKEIIAVSIFKKWGEAYPMALGIQKPILGIQKYKHSKKRIAEARAAYIFILPAMTIIGMFTIYPSIRLFFMSIYNTTFVNGKSLSEFIGLQNYRWIFDDSLFYKSLWNSFYFPLVVTPIQTAIALGMAILLNSRIKGIGFFRTVYFIPVVMSFVMIAIVWKNMLNTDFGVINKILRALGYESMRFLTSPSLSKPSIAFVSIWKSWAWYMVIFTSALHEIPEELYEAATIDGANAWQKFSRITMPMLRNSLLFVIIISTMNNIKVFTPVMIMTDGGPLDSSRSIVHYIWSTAFRMSNFGAATAMSVILFLIMLTVSLIQNRLLQSKD